MSARCIARSIRVVGPAHATAALATTIIGGITIAGTIQRSSASRRSPIGGIRAGPTTANAPIGGTTGTTATRPIGGAAGRATRLAIGGIHGITGTKAASTLSHVPATTQTPS